MLDLGPKFFNLVLLFLQTYLSGNVPPPTSVSPDFGLDIMGLVTRQGYGIDHHEVTTEDGYVLSLFNIRRGDRPGLGPPVLIMHGIYCSAADWVNTGSRRGLGYVLLDRGYDVWLGNARGSTWSRKHISISPNESKFWNFSFDEIGYYDLPAFIDYITWETGQEQVFYIGHSDGATAYFVMASERPEYNDKVAISVALAPVVYGSHAKNFFLRFLSAFLETVQMLGQIFGIFEVLAHSNMLTHVADMACRNGSPFQPVCIGLMFAVAGFDYNELDVDLLPVIFSNLPAGSSAKQAFHYAQIARSDIFRKFDYGNTNNLGKYRRTVPPKYNLTNVVSPVAVFYSGNDWLSSIYDVNKLTKSLPNVVLKYRMPDKSFNHWDYMWAKNVVKKLYNPVTELLDRYL